MIKIATVIATVSLLLGGGLVVVLLVNTALAQGSFTVHQLQMTQAQEQAYYDAHKDEFIQPEQVRLAEILIATPANAPTCFSPTACRPRSSTFPRWSAL